MTDSYKVQLDSAYNDFRIVTAESADHARRIVERTNDLPVKSVERR